MKERSKKYYEKNKEKKSLYYKRTGRQAKIKALTYYGNDVLACIKCGFNDIRALSIDHIYGRGAEERRRSSLRGATFYKKLIRENFPVGYQTLCLNCQFIKREENEEWRH